MEFPEAGPLRRKGAVDRRVDLIRDLGYIGRDQLREIVRQPTFLLEVVEIDARLAPGDLQRVESPRRCSDKPAANGSPIRSTLPSGEVPSQRIGTPAAILISQFTSICAGGGA
jgi:hypothetical protein